jgi:hypothetical protein
VAVCFTKESVDELDGAVVGVGVTVTVVPASIDDKGGDDEQGAWPRFEPQSGAWVAVIALEVAAAVVIEEAAEAGGSDESGRELHSPQHPFASGVVQALASKPNPS